MDEKTSANVHTLTLKERETGTISGVLDVQSFDTKEVLLKTKKGNLTIKGENVHVNKIDLEAGNVDIEGVFTSIVYTDDHAQRQQKGKSRLGHLFQ